MVKTSPFGRLFLLVCVVVRPHALLIQNHYCVSGAWQLPHLGLIEESENVHQEVALRVNAVVEMNAVLRVVPMELELEALADSMDVVVRRR